MSFRRRQAKVLAVVLLLFALLQVLVSRNYDLTNIVWTNSNFTSSRGTRVVGHSKTAFEIRSVPDNSRNVKASNHTGHEGHDGFENAARARNACTLQRIASPGRMNAIHAIPGRRLVYCPMEKIGTTFWRRLFYMLVVKNESKYQHPYDVPIDVALKQAHLFTHPIANAKSGTLLTKISFSFLFVRNPYSRVLSAFIDKIVPPNPTYWKFLGVPAVTRYRSKNVHFLNHSKLHGMAKPSTAGGDGHDVTFDEFLRYVVSTERSGRNINEHVISINKGCKPCVNPYTYIGRMETFKDDALFIMKKLHMNKTVEIMEESFSDYSTDDAITDSIRSPFEWKTDIIKSITWEKALQRIWLKLQMRGIIEIKITLDISKESIDKITEDKFIDMARTAHKKSDPYELKKQKEMVKKEAFASVRLSDVEAFRDTFKEDFALFGYDTSPSYIFDRGEETQAPTKFFNYSHLN